MKPQIGRNDSHLAYLEPPHSHDPASVSSIATLPALALNSMPTTVQTALYNLQQSTSIVFASYLRLQALLDERFDRLLPSIDCDGETTFSESSFFNYMNSLYAERTYLIADAHPDWRHKASLARVAVQPYHELLIMDDHTCPEAAPSSVLKWWQELEAAVASWCEYATVVHVPEYEDTISEYIAHHKHDTALASDMDESPLETPLATPTPVFDKEPMPLKISEIGETDFDIAEYLEKLVLSESGDAETMTRYAGDRLVDRFTSESTVSDDGKARDQRKDSGIDLKSRFCIGARE